MVKSFWTAARTHHRQERRASHHVERQHFEFYLPQIKALMSKGTERNEWLFPGFIFIKVKANQDWGVLASTRGIKQLFLGAEGKLTRMPNSDIEFMKSRENKEGFIRLLPSFAFGQPVLVGAKGSFDGLRGVCEGMTAEDRCMVYFGEVMGNRLSAEIDPRMLTAIATTDVGKVSALSA